jgi:hypothetical protein
METVDSIVSFTTPLQSRDGGELVAPSVAPTVAPQLASETAGELAARRSLRSQIAKLERELADTLVSTFDAGLYGRPIAGLAGKACRAVAPSDSAGAPRILSLGELELLRDELVARLRHARAPFAEHAEHEAARRALVERMLAEPEAYRFVRVRLPEPGARNCGTYQVRPRYGLIGMLAGWWHVKLSSGCPLPGGRGGSRGPHHRAPQPSGAHDH